MPVFTGRLEPVVPWTRHYSYDEWCEAVCQGYYAKPDVLKEHYDLQWDPQDCREYFFVSGRLQKQHPKPKKTPKPRIVRLGVDRVKQRLALALWRECSRLLARPLEPDARKIVCDTQEQVEKTAGIIPVEPG